MLGGVRGRASLPADRRWHLPSSRSAAAPGGVGGGGGDVAAAAAVARGEIASDRSPELFHSSSSIKYAI